MKQSNHIAANVVHAYDGDFAALELRAMALMLQDLKARRPGYKARKPGLLDQRIAAEKHERLVATYKARPEVKRDIMVALYGGTPNTSTGRLLRDEGSDIYEAVVASFGLKYTERGDFTHLSGRGI